MFQASFFIKQILLGVQHLHNHNVAHLDLKVIPTNHPFTITGPPTILIFLTFTLILIHPPKKKFFNPAGERDATGRQFSDHQADRFWPLKEDSARHRGQYTCILVALFVFVLVLVCVFVLIFVIVFFFVIVRQIGKVSDFSILEIIFPANMI